MSPCCQDLHPLIQDTLLELSALRESWRRDLREELRCFFDQPPARAERPSSPYSVRKPAEWMTELSVGQMAGPKVAHTPQAVKTGWALQSLREEGTPGDQKRESNMHLHVHMGDSHCSKSRVLPSLSVEPMTGGLREAPDAFHDRYVDVPSRSSSIARVRSTMLQRFSGQSRVAPDSESEPRVLRFRRSGKTFVDILDVMGDPQPTLQDRLTVCCWTLRRIVTSHTFDYVTSLVLILNAMFIGAQAEYKAKHVGDETPFLFLVVEFFFCMVFVVELSLRFAVFGLGFFRMKDWQWNLFDTSAVIFQFVDVVAHLIENGSPGLQLIGNGGVLRILRLGRVVRIARMVHLVPELKSMVCLISASMLSFFWAVVLFVLLIYCVAVYFTELATEIRAGVDDARIGQYWGSLGSSFLSLFQAISGGDDWANFIDVLEDSSQTLNTLVFSLYVLFATLVMLNLVTGVFVEGAQRILKDDKEAELLRMVRRLFSNLRLPNQSGMSSVLHGDEEGTNDIPWAAFAEQFNSEQMERYLKLVDLSDTKAEDLFMLLDADESGSISVEEFVQGCIRLRGPARSVELSILMHNFRVFTVRMEKQTADVERTLSQVMRTQEDLANNFSVGTSLEEM
eukprot:CAMPEP_0194523428 /NCGR_PEP_ID=MMETSP0253-20130528/58313_1 /TAXON_ID=2966 /ORGANISM="Noctiluca scintillans" /LENGTH=622 /DNA_ID=CAMNT_0039367967 /DNA_START=69 /DNA_END=1937 /DNA_ORIENTATION=+